MALYCEFDMILQGFPNGIKGWGRNPFPVGENHILLGFLLGGENLRRIDVDQSNLFQN